MARPGQGSPSCGGSGDVGGPVAHAVLVRVLDPTVAPVLAVVLLLGGLAAGCSDDQCHGQVYRPDLARSGAPTPIRALEVWLGTHGGIDQDPPVEGWIVEDPGTEDAERVVITNDEGDGWWVATVRTDDGGYVVSEATDHASGCEEQLS